MKNSNIARAHLHINQTTTCELLFLRIRFTNLLHAEFGKFDNFIWKMANFKLLGKVKLPLIKSVRSLYILARLMLKLMSTNHPIGCTVAAGNIDMLSTEGFLPSERKGLLQPILHKEVPALARLPFLWESVDWARNNCPLSVLTGVQLGGLNSPVSN